MSSSAWWKCQRRTGLSATVKLNTHPLLHNAGRKSATHRSSSGTKSGSENEAEAHIFAEPHDVVGSPGVVEEIAMHAPGKIWLRSGKIQRRFFTEGNQRRIQRLHKDGLLFILIAESRRNGVHVAIAGGNDVERRYLLARFIHHPALLIGDDRMKAQPERFGQPRGGLLKPVEIQVDYGFCFGER